jgi:hypothetical protein
MTASQTITIRIPMKIRKRGGRKLILTPDGAAPAWSAPKPRVDNTMVKAIARAFRWRRLLERGDYASINELAAAEKISPTYVGRVLRLTLLAPEIVEAVLAGKQAAGLTVAELMEPCSVVWAEQRSMRTR